MASSMIPSERRLTSTRKSAMIVLGKVPKPINLPSQKLENHGLDSNVEIVPRGTVTWGSRPLLASSSPWGSSVLSSPRADGSVGSPFHANGRPSSGGSGTRPSTGSSERSSEPSASSWGPSSRPSSASGILPTNHMSVASNRPHSAETRPNSSQLSRFAESSADSIAWGAAGTSEKVAAAASKRCTFTLSSGDFPTLGSEKNDEPKSQEGESPMVPTLASGLPSGPALHGSFNSWNVDTDPHTGEGASTRTENWHRDNHNAPPLLDANIPARQYGSWNSPTHAPNVVWYGGHEAGGLYRPPFVPPGSYNVDPYYPYVPAGPLPNAQAFSRPETIQGVVHLKKGEAYNRHMPPELYSAHDQSGFPVRPGVYPIPVFYDGGYGGPPRASFGNPSEQEVSTVGMPGHYDVHNHHPSENLRIQPWRFHAQSDGSAPVITKQQMIYGQANETQGQYKVLLKQHGGQEEKDTPEKERTVTIWSTSQRGKQPRFSTPEPDLGNSYKQEQTTDKQHGDVAHSHHPNDLADHNNRNSVGVSKSAGYNVMKKLDVGTVHISDQQNAITKKNASLMLKVEGLNSKTRVIDVHFEDENFPTKEKMKINQNLSSDADHLEKVGPANSSYASNTPISGTRNVSTTSRLDTSTEAIIHESAVDLKPALQQSDKLVIVPGKSNYSEDVDGHLQSHYQKRVHNMRGRVDHHHNHEKLKFGSYGADEMSNIPERDSLEKTSVITGKSGFLLSMPGSLASQDVPEDQGSLHSFKSVGDPSSLKSVDHDVQHSKLKELARQRAIDLQKEEDVRTAEQKAKGLAKLDELNMRTSAGSKQNSRHSQLQCNECPNKHDTTSGNDAKSIAVVSETPHTGLVMDFQMKRASNEDKIIKLVYSADTRPSCTSDSSIPEISGGRSVSDLQEEGMISRRKQTGYRRRRNITDERNQPEKLTNYERSVSPGILNSNDPLLQPNNKDNRVPNLFEKKNSDETMKCQDSIDMMIVASSQSGSETSKLTCERANNNWKPLPHRKAAKNLQSDKANGKHQGNETVVWTPVKVVNKNGSSEEVQKSSTASEVTNLPDGNNGAKARRAELERYIPKPIAKDVSLQGDLQQSSSSADLTGKQPPASAVTGRDAKTASTCMNITEDTKQQSRHGKTRASWRQRNSSESPSQELSALEGEPSKSVEKTSHEVQHSTTSDDLNDEPTTTSGQSVKQYHGVSRQRRQQSSSSPGPADSGERNPSRNENQNACSGHMKSHWQPKSHVLHPQHSLHGLNGREGQGAAAAPCETIEKNLDDSCFTVQRQRNKMIEVEVDTKKYEEGGNKEKKVMKIDWKNHEGLTGETKVMKQPSKDQNHFIDRASTGRGPTESLSANANSYQDYVGGVPRRGHGHGHNGGHFSPRGGRSSEQHLEYHQAAGYNKDNDMFKHNSSASEEARKAQRISSSGSRYGVQGRNLSRRGGGNFYGPRHAPSVRVSGAAYDIGG